MVQRMAANELASRAGALESGRQCEAPHEMPRADLQGGIHAERHSLDVPGQ
jgi:hypothetical protein